MSRVEHLSDDVTLYLGDCRDLLGGLPQVCAVVTDPPFGIGRDRGFGVGGTGKGGAARNCVKRYEGGWDAQRPSPNLMAEILTKGLHHIIWGGQFFARTLPESGKWLLWDKQQTMPSYGDGELAWTDLPGDAVKKFTLSINGIIARGETGLHPTQKPVALMVWCLGFLPNAQTILDPFMGSGTTGVACVQLGRKFIGIELEPRYFDIACRRISDELRRPRLALEPIAKPVQEAMSL